MNFDRSKNADCIIPTIPPLDPRCDDSEFALANPGVCPNVGAIIIKPSVLILCVNDSIQFQAYEYKNGVETLLTPDEVSFSSSDEAVFSIGARSGSGTCLSAGVVQISALHTDGRTASAALTANAEDECCDAEVIAASIVVDKSRSMTLGFGGGYTTRLNFAKAVATGFVDGMGVGTSASITASLSTLAETPEQVVAQTATKSTLKSAITTIAQTDKKTDLLDVFTTLTDTLLLEDATRRVLFLISDGEHTIDSNRQAVIDAATLFKSGGGIVMVVGLRASGSGYDLLQRIATGGYFINASATTATSSIAQVHYLMSLICAGICIPEGDTYEPAPALDYSAFLNFEVVSGQVNLLGPGLLDYLPGNGLYVEMASGSLGLIRTTAPISIVAGQTYRINFSVAGNQREYIAGQGVKIFVREVDAGTTDLNIFEQVVYPEWNDDFQAYGLSFTPLFDASVRLNFEQLGTDAAPSAGNLLDFIKFENTSTLTTILFDDFSGENLTYIPPRCGESSAVPAIDDPPAPVASAPFEYAGGSITSEDYNYVITYVTSSGETAKSETTNVAPFDPPSEAATRLVFSTPPEGVVQIRIWRDKEVSFGTPTFYLLATVEADAGYYDDFESHTVFALRYDSGTTAPTVNTTAVAAGELGEGLYCNIYDCASSPPGAQSSDSSPLPDIESGFNPPVSFTSTKTVCATCPTGTEVVTTENLIPVMTSNTTPSGEAVANAEFSSVSTPAWKAFDGADDGLFWTPGNFATGWIGYKFPSQKTVTRIEIQGGDINTNPKDFTFEGSNDNGSSWAVIATFAGQVWFQDELKSYPIVNTTAYSFYRINISSIDGPSSLRICELRMFGGGVSQACSTSTQTSFVSQQDADRLANDAALAAAQAQLSCVPFWQATESAQAVCPAGTFGETFIRSATRKSYVSLADAEQQAQAAAQALADEARDADCVGSNNAEQMTIPANGRALPYPGVKHVSGLTGVITSVTLSLYRFNHGDYGDVNIMLVSPEGTKLVVMSGAMNGTLDTTKRNITFDDAAGSFIPQASRPAGVDHTFKPRAYEVTTFPSPAPSNPSGDLYDGVGPIYADVGMAAFNGEDPNGSWSLWIYDDLALNSGYLLGGWDIAITSA